MICVINLLINFRGFVQFVEFFLTIDSCNMDTCLVYYQVSGEPGIASYSHRWDIYLGECGLAHKLIHWSSPFNFIFRGWSPPRNYFNSEISPIYGSNILRYSIQGNFWGSKLLRISKFYGYLCKFSPQNLWLWCLLMAPVSNLQKFSPWKLHF